MSVLLYYLAAINLVGLALMLWDKWKAANAKWRVPERRLIGVAVIGGSIGIFAGMRLFRHKTLHPKFSWGVPAIMGLQLAAGMAYLWRSW